MERKIIFKNTETGEELVMPVTPPEYRVEHGRKQNTETLYLVGDVTSPGAAVLLDEEPKFLLPAHDYPFNQPGTILNPFVYLEKLEKWSDAGTVLRYVVAGTPVNAAVRLGPIRYSEEDATNNVRCVVPIRGVRQPEAVEIEVAASAVPLAQRPTEKEPVRAESYTVVAGDTLSGIALRVYGDPGLAAGLGAYNGVKNIHLIRVGQVLNIPDRGQLPASAATQNGKVTAKSQAAGTVAVTVSFAGPDSYHGKAEVRYITEGGVAKTQIMSRMAPTATVRAGRGTKVMVARSRDSRNHVLYFLVDGRTKPGGAAVSVAADADHKIGVYWGL